MKSLIIRVLAALGLVPARRHAMLSRQVRALSKETRSWKKRATKASARIAELEGALQQQVKRVKEAHAAADQRAAVAKRENSEWTLMQTRLADAERALAIAREQLMAIEVKLDILEGAANVLDARTRAVTKRQPEPTTGAAV